MAQKKAASEQAAKPGAEAPAPSLGPETGPGNPPGPGGPGRPSERLNVIRMQGVKGRKPNGGGPDREPIEFQLQREQDVSGAGEPMTVQFIKDSIHDYINKTDEQFAKVTSFRKRLKEAREGGGDKSLLDFDEVDKIAKAAEDALKREPIGITLGRESLLMILSQNECEGIRFYFCEGPYKKNSIVAVGVRAMRKTEGGHLQEEEHPYEPGLKIIPAQDMGINNKTSKSILTTNPGDLEPVIMNAEVGPPYFYEQLISIKADGEGTGEREDSFIKELRTWYSQEVVQKKAD